MKINERFIKKAWVFSDLKGIRESVKSSTYNIFDYDKLPSVTANLSDDFNWFKPHKKYDEFRYKLPKEIELIHRNREIEGVDFSKELKIIEEKAKNLGLTLPISFINFLSNPEINGKIWSNTDCFFELGDFIEKVTVDDEDYYLLHFMSDSQYCYLWYICFNHSGEYFILASHKIYGHDRKFENEDSDFTDFIGYYCSSSFEEFIYRISIENRIWFKTSWYKAELEADEKEYITHYLNQ